MGKTSYKAGYWTLSTLKVLEYISSENSQGRKPKAKNMSTGTLRNWAYTLKGSGHLSNGDGFALTELGEALLIKLRTNPPAERRGRSKSRLKQQKVNLKGRKEDKGETQIAVTSNYQISIRGNDVAFDVIILTKEQALEAVNVISNLLSKKR